MSDSIIRVAKSRNRFRKSAKDFLKRPINISLITLLIVGLYMLLISGSMHPVYSTTISQQNVYPVSSNITNETAFSLFPNKVTYAQFEMPQKQKISFSLHTLITIHVTPSATYPSGTKTVWKEVANGTAEQGTVIPIRSSNNAFTISSIVSLSSLTGGTYNVTINSYAYYNSSLSFSPKYAITGLALTVVSATVIASAAGIKTEEF